ncbi:MAG: hypothetical protein N2039_13975, partial [Gemmataceae bacterium]|nr:hypothetical protein [Gemmataceae bacterium]
NIASAVARQAKRIMASPDAIKPNNLLPRQVRVGPHWADYLRGTDHSRQFTHGSEPTQLSK